jgi:serine protease Do
MRRAALLGSVLVVGCVLGVLLTWSGVIASPEAAGTPPVAAPPRSSSLGVGMAPDAVVTGDGTHSRFAVLAQQVAPGVVNVHTSKTVVQSMPDFGAPFGGLFGELFRGPFGGPQQPQQPGQPGRPPAQRQFTVPSLGTGFVISEDGLIVTNTHVVEGVEKIEIVFSDGTRSAAEVVGQDAKTDVALIRAKADRDYSPLPLGDSDALLPGDWVIAVGNPFGLDHTVTAGIVSATGRDIGQGPYDDFIQTDAAINPGNSGGPLLNLAGEVVGINAAINPQANTIGFAVPINMAKEILPQLEEKGHVVRGWLGVAVQPITPDLADAMKLDTETGALVSQVMPGSPAEKAGLERGDVIVGFGGTEIDRMRELPRMAAATAPGTRVEVEVVRDGKRKTLKVEMAELDEEQAAVAPSAGQSDRGSTSFGFDIADVPAALRDALGLGENEGAVISQVYPGGPAESAGLRRGDVILEVDRSRVSGGLDAEQKLVKAGDAALLLVRRDDGSLYVAVKRSGD